MVTGLPIVSCRDGVCADCVLNKHHRDSFDKRASWHASGPLQLVQSDLCGPLSSPSFYGCKYFLTFIDDFSRRTWVYFLKLKSKVFDKLLAYTALVEEQSGHQIQKLRIDNGGEYVNNNFASYCITQGIQMQHTIPYTPQQNGVAECYRTVCRKGLRQLESRLKTGVTGASPPTVTSMGSSFYLGWLVQGRRPYVIWVLEGLRDNGSR
jgi:transposase InsO family protein